MIDTPPQPLYTHADGPVPTVAVREVVTEQLLTAAGFTDLQYVIPPAWTWWGLISIGLFVLGGLHGRLRRPQAPVGQDTSAGAIKRYKDTWNIILDVGSQFDPETGAQKRVQKWITVQGTKRDAEKKLADLLHDLHRSQDMEPSKSTLDEWLSQWLETAIKPPNQRLRPDQARYLNKTELSSNSPFFISGSVRELFVSYLLAIA
jgi:hypothetical protein